MNTKIINNDLKRSINESVSDESQRNQRPMNKDEWTFADWFGRDLSDETYTGDSIFIDANSGVTSLKGAPKKVNGDFIIRCSIKSLKGSPEEVTGRFSVVGSALQPIMLKSLDGAPKKVGSFTCRLVDLDSLKGAPQEIEDKVDCSWNRLSSLKGLPEGLDIKNIRCDNNRSTAVEMLAEYIGSDAVISKKEQEEDVGALEDILGIIEKYDDGKILHGIKDLIKHIKSLPTLDV